MSVTGIHWSLLREINADREYTGRGHTQSQTAEPINVEPENEQVAAHLNMDGGGTIRLDIFPLFALLPKELRLQIWNFALRPRVIPLHRSDDRLVPRSIHYPKVGPAMTIMALSTNSSLDTIRRVCPEAQRCCERTYIEWGVWDVSKSHVGVPYCPTMDVIYFSHHISPGYLLDFARQYPVETDSIVTLALPGLLFPGQSSRVETLATLHAFESLKELIIVTGKPRLEQGLMASEWWGGTEFKDSWTLPDGVLHALDQLKRDRWPDWKLPTVTIVERQEELLKK